VDERPKRNLRYATFTSTLAQTAQKKRAANNIPIVAMATTLTLLKTLLLTLLFETICT